MEKENSYRIGELVRMFGITSRTVRFYEELGLIESMDRDGSEHRRYSERNVIRIKRIQQLKDYGLTLSEISALFEMARVDRTGATVREGLAVKYRQKLDEALKRRAQLDAYIEDLSWHVEQVERANDFFECPGASCAACRWSERCDVRLLVKRPAS